MRAVTGFLLAGGLSSRMGRDKRLLCLRPGDPPFLERMAALLAGVTGRVVVSSRRAADTVPPGNASLEFLEDEPGAEGPLGAVLGGLLRLHGPLLVCPCDLPFMEKPVLERLLAEREQRAPHEILTAWRQRETGRIEPLAAVYEPECVPYLSRARDAGIRGLHRCIPEEKRRHILYSANNPAEALPFFNVNSPGDLERARVLLDTREEKRKAGAAR